MMNLTADEKWISLVIFNAPREMARRNRVAGDQAWVVRRRSPTSPDEVMTAARRDIPYAEIRDMAGRLLTSEDVEPGVPQMVPMLYIECHVRRRHQGDGGVRADRAGRGAPPPSAIVPGEIIAGGRPYRAVCGSAGHHDRRREHGRSRCSGAQPRPFLRGQPRPALRLTRPPGG